jgi:preprotein translocase subunit YajC
MRAVWLWIKWGGLLVLIMAMVVLWGLLQRSETKQIKLKSALEKAVSDNQANLAAIATLNNEAAAANRLLVARQRTQQQQRQELTDEIASLREKMAKIECAIPSDVTERLRRPY